MKNNSFTVAVLGAGNIGSAVIERLLEVDNEVLNLNLSKVLVSDLSKERDIDGGLLTTDFDEILNDENIDLVIEVLGGVEPGKGYIKDLLESGKSVITANKDIVADSGSELIQIAQKNNVCLFMKGTPDSPQCGFSMTVSNILKHLNVNFHGVNVLEDENLRQGIKTFSDWPTIPQLYVKEEFIGGCDIVKEMFEKGELKKILQEKKIL